MLCCFPSVLSHCWLGDRKGSQPVKSWVLVCWWWRFDWSFARLMAAVVTTTSIILSSNKIQNGDILVSANPGTPNACCTSSHKQSKGTVRNKQLEPAHAPVSRTVPFFLKQVSNVPWKLLSVRWQVNRCHSFQVVNVLRELLSARWQVQWFHSSLEQVIDVLRKLLSTRWQANRFDDLLDNRLLQDATQSQQTHQVNVYSTLVC